MNLGIVSIIVFLFVVIILMKLLKFGLKIIGLIILFLVLGVTIYVCSTQPDMHKPFSLNTIEYLFKINKDGSMTTTKQVTQTIIHEKEAH